MTLEFNPTKCSLGRFYSTSKDALVLTCLGGGFYSEGVSRLTESLCVLLHEEPAGREIEELIKVGQKKSNIKKYMKLEQQDSQEPDNMQKIKTDQ